MKSKIIHFDFFKNKQVTNKKSNSFRFKPIFYLVLSLLMLGFSLSFLVSPGHSPWYIDGIFFSMFLLGWMTLGIFVKNPSENS